MQEAFVSVLSALSAADYLTVTDNLIIMAMHEGATGQVMHFTPAKKMAIMQFSIPKSIPINALKSVIAHELGHGCKAETGKNQIVMS